MNFEVDDAQIWSFNEWKKIFTFILIRALPQNLASSFVKIICLIAILQKRLYGLTV